jgi:hypothetical protein
VKAGKTIYNFREQKIGPETYTLSGHSVFLQEREGRNLSHLRGFHSGRSLGAFARGDEQFMGIFGFLDVLPKGREEYGPARSIPDWAKVHDRYENNGKGQMACGCVTASGRQIVSREDARFALLAIAGLTDNSGISFINHQRSYGSFHVLEQKAAALVPRFGRVQAKY